MTEPSVVTPARSTRSRQRDAALAALIEAVAAEFGVSAAALRASRRGAPRAAEARQIAMYLAHVALGRSYRTIAAAFGRDRSTAAHACRRIEDRRDDAAFDRRLGALEARVADAGGSAR